MTRDEKLSKRSPMGTLDELVDEGFLAVSVRRYLAELLGQGDRDLLAEGAEPFDFSRVPTGAPRVDRARLELLGREDMASLDAVELLEGTPIAPTGEIVPLVLELAAAAPSRVAFRGELRLVFDGPGAGDLPHVIEFVAPDAPAMEAMALALDLAEQELRKVDPVEGEGWQSS